MLNYAVNDSSTPPSMVGSNNCVWFGVARVCVLNTEYVRKCLYLHRLFFSLTFLKKTAALQITQQKEPCLGDMFAGALMHRFAKQETCNCLKTNT